MPKDKKNTFSEGYLGLLEEAKKIKNLFPNIEKAFSCFIDEQNTTWEHYFSLSVEVERLKRNFSEKEDIFEFLSFFRNEEDIINDKIQKVQLCKKLILESRKRRILAKIVAQKKNISTAKKAKNFIYSRFYFTQKRKIA
jgi:hypothetical protein